MAIIHEVNEPTWSGNENITAVLDLNLLVSLRTTAIGNTRTKHGSIAKTTGIVEDLDAQLSSWGDDENQGLTPWQTLSSGIPISELDTRGSKLLNLSYQFGNGRDEEGGSLARA